MSPVAAAAPDGMREHLWKLTTWKLQNFVGKLIDKGDLPGLRLVLSEGLHIVAGPSNTVAVMSWLTGDDPARRALALEWAAKCDMTEAEGLAVTLYESIRMLGNTISEREIRRLRKVMDAGAELYAPVKFSRSGDRGGVFDAALAAMNRSLNASFLRLLEQFVLARPGVIPMTERGTSIFFEIFQSGFRDSEREYVRRLCDRIARGRGTWAGAHRALDALDWSGNSLQELTERAAAGLYPVAISPGLPDVAREIWERAVQPPELMRFAFSELQMVVESSSCTTLAAVAAWSDYLECAQSDLCAAATFLVSHPGGLNAEAERHVIDFITGFVKQVRVAGADLDAPITGRGHTPLQVASAFGWIESVRALLAAGADPAVRGHGGHTALEFAVLARVRRDRDDVLQLLSTNVARASLVDVAARVKRAREAARGASFMQGEALSPVLERLDEVGAVQKLRMRA
jgi:hypothetical protein